MLPLRITAEMGAPLISTGQPWHLDGILLQTRISVGQGTPGPHPIAWEPDPETAPKLPFAILRFGGRWWYRCSAVFPPPGSATNSWTKRFRRDRVDLLAMGKATQIVTTLGPYKDMRVPVEEVALDRLVWYAVGNRRDLWRLIKRTYHVGKKPAQGYGAIRRWTIESMGQDGEWYAEEPRDFRPADAVGFDLDFRRPDGGPARNVPFDLCAELGIEAQGSLPASLIPPYWIRDERHLVDVAR
jgi:CRISPR type IV-associated protein Csf3